jgi:hypothetical protein
MPLGTPQPIVIFPAQINVPMDHLFISMSLQSDGTPEGNALLETVPQELIDYLQEWTGRQGNVTGQVYDTSLVPISPTNPDLADPPEDPE